jgi:hypothetical protein
MHLNRPLTVLIEKSNSERSYEAVMKLRRNGAKAQISSGWARAMRKLNIKKDKVYMFLFDLLQDDRLAICLWKIEE